MKLLIQFDETPRTIPYARLESGQTLLKMTQPQGPQLYQKLMTKSHTMAPAAQPIALWGGPLVLVYAKEDGDDRVADTHAEGAG